MSSSVKLSEQAVPLWENMVRAMGYLRNADMQDLDLLFGWVNERSVRQNAFSSQSIVYEEHKKWFKNLLMSHNARQYIYVSDDKPIGQVRVSVEGEDAEIDYSICLQERDKGHGKEMISLLRKQVRQDFPDVKKLIARVKPGNTASQKVFEDTGYAEKYRLYELQLSDS